MYFYKVLFFCQPILSKNILQFKINHNKTICNFKICMAKFKLKISLQLIVRTKIYHIKISCVLQNIL